MPTAILVLGGLLLLAAGPAAPPPVPAGWDVVRSDEVDGVGLDVLIVTSGNEVGHWVQSTTESVLRRPNGRSALTYTHVFDTSEHARAVWLGVLRLAEEPDIALAPRVLDDVQDAFIYGVASPSTDGGDEQYLAEEAHRVVGNTVTIFIVPRADVSLGLPSPDMQALLTAHQSAFPRDQFDLPRPSTVSSSVAKILFLVFLLAGSVILVSALLLIRRSREE